jgi:hypothetical protein
MGGAKRILVFSDAGGTGRSYHASLDAKNQQRRMHFLLEPGWRADRAIQGLGRTNRRIRRRRRCFVPSPPIVAVNGVSSRPSPADPALAQPHSGAAHRAPERRLR